MNESEIDSKVSGGKRRGSTVDIVPNCWLIWVAVLLSPIAIGHSQNLCMVESGEEQCGQVLAKNLATAQSVDVENLTVGTSGSPNWEVLG